MHLVGQFVTRENLNLQRKYSRENGGWREKSSGVKNGAEKKLPKQGNLERKPKKKLIMPLLYCNSHGLSNIVRKNS